MASKGCPGCDFIAVFTPHEGGFCKIHGDVPPTDDAVAREEKIEKLGGNKLSIEEDVKEKNPGLDIYK